MLNSGLKIGNILDQLKLCSQEAEVEFDFCGMTPKDLISYRGYYEDLCITPDIEPITVAELVEKIEKTIGTETYGYKGGTYRVYPDTTVWVSRHGRADEVVIRKIHQANPFEVVLITSKDWDWSF